MPHAYSKKDLHATYDTIAMTRPHFCDECGTALYLSHSHLLPKGLFGKFATLEKNIVYHCMSMGDKVGCHTKFEGMDVAKMKKFEEYYRIIHSLDRQFFWQKMHKLMDHWVYRDIETWRRVKRLFAEIDLKEHPRKETL